MLPQLKRTISHLSSAEVQLSSQTISESASTVGPAAKLVNRPGGSTNNLPVYRGPTRAEHCEASQALLTIVICTPPLQL